MSQAPSTFGSMMTSSLWPMAATISVNIVEHPRRIERVDARPQSGLAKIATLGHGDEAVARCRFGVGRNGVLEIAEHHIDLMHQLGHPRAHFLDMRRHEMDHALEPQRQFAQRRRRPDRERLEEIARQFHRTIPQLRTGKARMNGGTPPSRFWRQQCLGNGVHTISPRISRGCEAAGATPSRISARRSGPMRSTR